MRSIKLLLLLGSFHGEGSTYKLLPISLLCCFFKLLETRMTPYIDYICTVRTGGLMLNLAHMIPSRKTLKLLSTMTGIRQFHVVIGGDSNKSRKINIGVPQESVIAPTLLNIYISNMHSISQAGICRRLVPGASI